MGLPALLTPFESPTTPPLPDIDEEAREALKREADELIESVRRGRPTEGSPEETRAIVRMSLFAHALVRALGDRFVDVLRQNINGACSSLVRRELEAAEPERKLALRHLQQAVHTFGVVTESFGRVLSEIPAEAVVGLLDELAEQVKSGDVPMRDAERVVARLQLDVFVALAVLDGPLEDLTFWAHRALNDARRVEAMPASLSTVGLRGELARIRSKRAWLDWDADEIAEELAPWPTPSR